MLLCSTMMISYKFHLSLDPAPIILPVLLCLFLFTNLVSIRVCVVVPVMKMYRVC